MQKENRVSIEITKGQLTEFRIPVLPDKVITLVLSNPVSAHLGNMEGEGRIDLLEKNPNEFDADNSPAKLILEHLPDNQLKIHFIRKDTTGVE